MLLVRLVQLVIQEHKEYKVKQVPLVLQVQLENRVREEIKEPRVKLEQLV